MLFVDEFDDLALREYSTANIEPSISSVEYQLSSIEEISKMEFPLTLSALVYTPLTHCKATHMKFSRVQTPWYIRNE